MDGQVGGDGEAGYTFSLPKTLISAPIKVVWTSKPAILRHIGSWTKPSRAKL